MPQDNTVLMEGVRIIFRNFTGKEGKFNKPGDRNFGVVIPPGLASQLNEDGWPVKVLEPREQDEGEEGTPWLPVSIRFDVFPPRVVLVTSNGRTQLGEDQVEMLDWADITNVDLIVRPYNWEMPGGKSGVKAYVKTMYVTIEEDALEAKYGIGDGPQE